MGSKSLSSTLETPPPERVIASPSKKRKAQDDTGERDVRPETKEKRKKKSRKAEQGTDDGTEAATPGVGVDGEVQTKKAKKHKKKHSEDMELIVSKMSEGVDEGTVRERRSKETQGSDHGEGSDSTRGQRKKRDKGVPVSEGAVLPEGERKSDKTQKPKGKKTKVGKDDTVLADTDRAVAIGKEKKEKREKKKRPRNEKDGDEDDQREGKKKKTRLTLSQDAEDGTETFVKKSSKQRRKGKPTDLPDPEEDESLSEQARKALSYAFIQFVDPETWKFNKARQNWLLRNMWSETTIPDKYVGLLTRYLVNVQGAVRENLIKNCQNHLSLPLSTELKGASDSPLIDATDAQTPVVTEASSKRETDSASVATTSPSAQTRARAVLVALGVLVS